MGDFLFHKVSEKEKQKIKEQAKELLRKFENKLSEVHFKNKEIEKPGNSGRRENKFEKPFLSKKIMFENAPSKNENFIVAEKKDWD